MDERTIGLPRDSFLQALFYDIKLSLQGVDEAVSNLTKTMVRREIRLA